MKITEPKLDHRAERPYMGIRVQVPMIEMEKGVIPELLGEVMAWLETQGVAPAGSPFIRYHVINMAGMMDIEMGWPVHRALPGNGRIRAGVLPPGRYVSLVYTGILNGIKGNKALLDWVKENGLTLDRWDVENGDAFRSRYESYLTDPKDEPDQTEWETEVAIKVADGK